MLAMPGQAGAGQSKGTGNMETEMNLVVPGLELEVDFIDEDQEREMLSHIREAIEALPARAWKFRSHVLRYGWDYSGDKWVRDLPEWLDIEETGYDSVTINHYEPGQAIASHVDSLRFDDPIEVLSLAGDCTLRFSKGGDVVDLPVPARSLLCMGGEARYDWEHEVLPCKAERFSIVFRKKVSTGP